MDLKNGYAVIDLEMAGGDPEEGLIIEIAAGVWMPDRKPTTDRVLVKIDRPIAKSIVKLTGITDRDLAAGGIPIQDALAWFKKQTQGLPLVGHSILKADRPYLLGAARKHQGTETVIDEEQDLPAERFIDTAALYKGYLIGEYPRKDETHQEYADRMNGTRTYGIRTCLEAACEDLRLPVSSIRAHRSIGDVLLNRMLFEKLLELNPPE